MVSSCRRSQVSQTDESISIIFSAWKKTLNMAAELFKRDGMRYGMIEGSLSLNQRLKVLKEFKSSIGPNILLMTLGTGAEGFVHTQWERLPALTQPGLL